MLFGEQAVWICGDEPLAGVIRAGLRRAGRRVHSVDSNRLGRLRPGDGQTLILVDSPNALPLIHGLKGRLTQRRWRREPLRVILVHQADPPPPLPPELADLDPEGPLRLETFALEDRAARALLGRWPLHFGMDPRFGQVPHLLILGTAPPARAFLLQALRLMQYGEERPRVTLVCADPDSAAAGFARDHPQAGQIAALRWTTLSPLRPWDPEPGPAVTQVLVCLDPPDSGLDQARRLAKHLAQEQGISPPILLEVGDAEPVGGIEDWDGQIFPFSYLREACRPEVLLDGAGDRLAQTIHEHYTDSIAAQGRDPAAEPAGQPWPRLAATYRDANRRQADHLGAKLAVTDCRAEPEERVESFAFAPLEAERLAVIEHLRWAADRYLDGWTYAPKRDNARKHHPQLVPYPSLSEPMKDLDRYAVRGVPALLARSGLGVVRVLILGLPDPAADCPLGAPLARLADQALDRLLERYPDRSLVVASTLADPRVRLVARRARERTGAALWLLCPRPIAEVLGAQPDADARRDLLWLVARAERRIALPSGGELGRWLAERAEIILALGPGPSAAPGLKSVRLDPSARRLDWGFEY
ncbi:MAG: RyR domain-containing protein [Bdellovibrio bacteriovorus]